MEEDRRSVLEEHAIPERHGMLGGRSLEATPEGKIHRTSFLLACDYCGRFPLNEFVICRSCRGKLCDDCSINLDGRSYCRGCLLELLPLSRNSYKVLMCLESGIESPSKISDLTRLEKDEVKSALALLTELKLLETKGLLVFLERKVTPGGVRALSLFRKVYGEDEDALEVRRKLTEEAADGT